MVPYTVGVQYYYSSIVWYLVQYRYDTPYSSLECRRRRRRRSSSNILCQIKVSFLSLSLLVNSEQLHQIPIVVELFALFICMFVNVD